MAVSHCRCSSDPLRDCRRRASGTRESSPLSMNEEGAGPKSPFWPSSAQHQHRRPHPFQLLHGLRSSAASATRTSTSSGRAPCTTSPRSTTSSTGSPSSTCRTSSGTQGSKWCAGCHDHAVFFNGRFDRPIKEQIDTPEAQNGLGCMSCHSIVHVGSTMGNGDFTIDVSAAARARSTATIRGSARSITSSPILNPEPHRRTFMKPFMREDSAEYLRLLPQGPSRRSR